MFDRKNWQPEALFRMVSERSDWKRRHTKNWRAPEVLLLTFWSALASSRAKSEHYKSATPDSKRHVCYLNSEVEAVAVFRCLARLAVHPAAQQPGST